MCRSQIPDATKMYIVRSLGFGEKDIKSVYHMALLLFRGLRNVINNIMARCITLTAGTSKVMTPSVIAMQIFIEINNL